jgi:hypothetical protein
MIHIQNSLTDFKLETLYLREDSQIPVPGDSFQIKRFGDYDLLLLKIKACPFIVDWQLTDIEQTAVFKTHY